VLPLIRYLVVVLGKSVLAENSPARWRVVAAALAIKNPSHQIGWQTTALLICGPLDCQSMSRIRTQLAVDAASVVLSPSIVGLINSSTLGIDKTLSNSGLSVGIN
jgi:hypothetical protein